MPASLQCRGQPPRIRQRRTGRKPDVRALAEQLNIDHARQPLREPRVARSRSAAMTSITSPLQAGAKRRRRVQREQPAFVQQRDARAALGLVEIRRRHQDRDALAQKLRQQLPELAPRHRIDARGRLVEQDDLRVRAPACRRAPASASCRRRADPPGDRGTASAGSAPAAACVGP